MSGSLFAQSLDHVRRLDTARARQEAPLMTEVPQATAREEAVKRMAEVLWSSGFWTGDPKGPNHWERECCRELLDALLSPRTVPCATCGGTGRRLLAAPSTLTEPCPDCSDGSVTLGPLAVLHDDLVYNVRWSAEAGYSLYNLRRPSSKEPHA